MRQSSSSSSSSSSSRDAPFSSAARSPGAGLVSPGLWLLVTFLCLSLPSSLAYHLHTKGLAANLSDCLVLSSHLMDAADTALHQLQKQFNCTMEYNVPANPKNEEKIMKACMGGSSLKSGLCPSGENDAVDQTLCMDTIYKILKHYKVEIKDLNSPDLYRAVYLMMQALKVSQNIMEQPLSSPQHPFSKTFEMEMKECKILLTLQQLSQTVDRILSYWKSLETQM